MAGKWITSCQIRLYMESKQRGKTNKVAAAVAGFSERSTYRIEERSHQPSKRKRGWKTRLDPFESAWEKELMPLLQANPKLEARTLLEELQRRYEDQYPDKLLRTLQRRVKQWKAISGPEKEVIFRQNHPPGWQGISDFTNADELDVTIQGDILHHLFYHYRLAFSGWEYAQVILGGESYTALAEGVQNAFWNSGGVPTTHRTDSLSAAYKNCSDKTKEEFTESYRELCEHYGTEPTRNNKGISHENGSIESPNRHLKNKIAQALMLRGSRDFTSIDIYRAFVCEIIARSNKRIEKEYTEEREFLKLLPERKTTDYSEERVRVTSSSTISIKSVVYSVPSRLIGMILKVHLYDDRLECYAGADCIGTFQRIRRNKTRRHCIDYHHIIGSLHHKPQAFRHYTYRDDLFPSFAFRQAWELMDKQLDSKRACNEFVKILHEASRPECEKKVNGYLETCLSEGRLPKSEEVKNLFAGTLLATPSLKETRLQLSDYDVFLVSQQGGSV